MNRIILILLVLFPSTVLADRLGSLTANSDIKLTTQSASIGLPLPGGDTSYIQNNQTTTVQPATAFITSMSVIGLVNISTDASQLSGNSSILTLQTSTSIGSAGGTPMMVLVDTASASSSAEMDWNWLFNSGVGSTPALYARETVYSQGITPTINGDIGWAVKSAGTTTEMLRLIGSTNKLRIGAGTAAINYSLGFHGATNDGNISWMDSQNEFQSLNAWTFGTSSGTTITSVGASSFSALVTISTSVSVSGSVGTNGQFLTSGGPNATPSWTTAAASSGGSALTTATGTASGFSGFLSTATTVVVMDSNTHTGQLTGGSTAFYALKTSSVTLQANTFNGATQLVQTNSSSFVPNANLDGSSVTKYGALFSANSNLTISQGVGVTTFTVLASTVVPYADGTGATGRVAFWQNTTTITSNANFTFSTTTLTMTVSSVAVSTIYLSTFNGGTTSSVTYSNTAGEIQTSTAVNINGYATLNGGIAMSTVTSGIIINAGSTNTTTGNLQVNTGSNANALMVNASTNSVEVNVQTYFSSSVAVGNNWVMVSTNNFFQVGTSTTAAFTKQGHFETHQTTWPTVSSCGTGGPTSANSNSTDTNGSVTTGTSATACTMTFSQAFKNAPVCVMSDSSTSGFVDVTSVNTTSITWGLSATLSTVTIYYHCFGVQ